MEVYVTLQCGCEAEIFKEMDYCYCEDSYGCIDHSYISGGRIDAACKEHGGT